MTRARLHISVWVFVLTFAAHVSADDVWWSLRPIKKPDTPPPPAAYAKLARTPVDAFIFAKLREQGLTPSPEADRRTLIRRLYFDLIGLPPSPEAVEAFERDDDPRAYEKLVDQLLASPRYGERWARHWLDVVHYGDTHGFDKDKVRPNAWPYRDYVIRAFNEDKPYGRFVAEQLAGDVLYPGSSDGVVATGFIAAGPFDFVGQIEVRNGTVEKRRVRNIDRDDMVRTATETLLSLTVGCARCHDHKFDPISQADYYNLQAVFAGVDRADRPYDVSPEQAARRVGLQKRIDQLEKDVALARQAIARQAGPRLGEIDRRLAELSKPRGKKRPEFGYHSRIEKRQDTAKWVQVDLGRRVALTRIVLRPCHDEYAGIGAGFGFPVRYRVEVSNKASFERSEVIADRTKHDEPNPGMAAQAFEVRPGVMARYVRVTATKLAPRSNDYIFALAELEAAGPDGRNAAAGRAVTSRDSIEAPARWRKANLVDGIYFDPTAGVSKQAIAKLKSERQALLEAKVQAEVRSTLERASRELETARRQLAALPKQGVVYAAATDFKRQGNFAPTGGQPRAVHMLNRGDVKQPGAAATPGALSAVDALPAAFSLPDAQREGDRRAALARWIIDKRNPLTWRSIVNRVWHYHFGRGIAASPNDFGRMGTPPSHPALLDWLAAEFRDNGQSIKQLHRLIVTSHVYRQSSAHAAAHAKLDAGNRFLWRMNRRRIEAEAVRDSVLALAGKLDATMYGPGFRPFGFKDDHSPHYKYHEYNPDDPATHRRSIYRFIVRSVPDPFMETLDCADPSLIVEQRNETLTALQALALLNNKFMVRMAEHFAARVQTLGKQPREQITAAYRLAFGRAPTPAELATLTPLVERHGLPNVCRLIFNANEFVFVD